MNMKMKMNAYPSDGPDVRLDRFFQSCEANEKSGHFSEGTEREEIWFRSKVRKRTANY